MANSRLQHKEYPVPENLKKFVGPSISYENMKMTKTRLARLKDNPAEYNSKGGDALIKWMDETLKKDRDAISTQKDTGMKAGRENQFIKPHEKDRDNANPTGVGGIPKIGKGSISRKIMTNKEVYNESLSKEIVKIKYLIEYINNKKQKI